MTIDKVIAELRAAIEAGPTKGGWSGPRYVIYPTLYGDGWAPVHAQKRGEILRCKRVADAAYVAACSPDRIQRLLDALDASLLNASRYEWLRDAIDRPDGYYTPHCRISQDHDYASSDDLDEQIDAAIDSAKQP